MLLLWAGWRLARPEDVWRSESVGDAGAMAHAPANGPEILAPVGSGGDAATQDGSRQGPRAGGQDGANAVIDVAVRVAPDGVPVPHAPLCLVGRTIVRATADEHGRARLPVAAGAYFIGTDPPEGSQLLGMPLVVDAVGGTAEAELTVGPREVARVELFLQPASFISGRVAEPNGAPLSEPIMIEGIPEGPAWMQRIRVQTDINGYFRSEPLFAGTYVLAFARDGGPVVAPTTVEVVMGESRSVALEALLPREVTLLLDLRAGAAPLRWPFPATARLRRTDELRMTSDERRTRYGHSAAPEPVGAAGETSVRSVTLTLRPGPYEIELASSGWSEGQNWIAPRPRIKRPFMLADEDREVRLIFDLPALGPLARIDGRLSLERGDHSTTVGYRYVDRDGASQVESLDPDFDTQRFRLWIDLDDVPTREVEFVQFLEPGFLTLATLQLSPGDHEIALTPASR